MCSTCGAFNQLVVVGRRPFALVDSEIELTTAKALSLADMRTFAPAAFPSLTLAHGSLVIAYGESGSGKSTMLCRALDTIAGPVLLVSVEEPPGPSLTARLRRAGIKRDDFYILGRATVDQMVEVCRRQKVVAMCVDSCQPALLSARDLRHLLTVIPTLRTLLAVAQVNARGEVAGRNELIHEADVVVRVDQWRWVVEKSRYGDAATMHGSTLSLSTEGVRDAV
jgi:predicted ATP-dependent serine protease